MIRSLLRSALRTTIALALTAGAGLAIADDLSLEPTPAAPEMLPTTDTAAPVDPPAPENWPDSNCPPGTAGHGGHKHGAGNGYGYGHFGHNRMPYGFYPNGITNYAWKVSPHMYAGAGGCRTCSGGQCQYRFYGQ